MFIQMPRSLRNPDTVVERLALLKSHNSTASLRDWSLDLARRRSAVVPHFDPTDAGTEARVLFLLEAPGPMTNAANRRPGSGFISVDNDDQTAENAWHARSASGLTHGVLQWNIVPWYLGPASTKPTASELAQGAMELRGLLQLLPSLRAVILAGRYAQNGWTKHVAPFVGSDLSVIETWHPSPLSMNQPGHREQFSRAIERAARFV